MSGAHSRRKGAAFERELVHRFREVMPDAGIRRGLQFRTGENPFKGRKDEGTARRLRKRREAIKRGRS